MDEVPIILVEGLTFRYPAGPVALNDMRITVHADESIGIVGPNGAGKTSFFHCLCGVLSVPPGVVRVAGLDLGNRADKRSLPSRLGIVFQSSDDQLFNATVFDDVAFGPLNLGLEKSEVRRRVAAALEHVGLSGFEARVPFHLSGGEKRRVALAGVLAMQPEILLLDEPSMYLDPRGRRELIRLINSLSVTRLIAAHDLELIRETCKRVVVLDVGKIVADGPTREILGDRSLMERHGLEVPHSLSHHSPWEKHHTE